MPWRILSRVAIEQNENKKCMLVKEYENLKREERETKLVNIILKNCTW